jgi:hypothetical protein
VTAPRRRRWPWAVAGVAVLAVALTVAGVSPYGILMHNDDHAGASRGCRHAAGIVAQAEERSGKILSQAAGSVVAAGTALSAPRLTTQSAAGGESGCLTVSGFQDLPDAHMAQAAVTAKLDAAWSAAGYARVSPTVFTTPDGYGIALGSTSDGRLWLSSTSPPVSP